MRKLYRSNSKKIIKPRFVTISRIGEFNKISSIIKSSSGGKKVGIEDYYPENFRIREILVLRIKSFNSSVCVQLDLNYEDWKIIFVQSFWSKYKACKVIIYYLMIIIEAIV